jgi:hypothetical protein
MFKKNEKFVCKYSNWLNVHEMYIRYPQNDMDRNSCPSRLVMWHICEPRGNVAIFPLFLSDCSLGDIMQ